MRKNLKRMMLMSVTKRSWTRSLKWKTRASRRSRGGITTCGSKGSTTRAGKEELGEPQGTLEGTKVISERMMEGIWESLYSRGGTSTCNSLVAIDRARRSFLKTTIIQTTTLQITVVRGLLILLNSRRLRWLIWQTFTRRALKILRTISKIVLTDLV